MPNAVDRVAEAANHVKLLRLVLSLLALPFYCLGWLVGLVVVALRWIVAAVQVGMADAQRRDDEADESPSGAE